MASRLLLLVAALLAGACAPRLAGEPGPRVRTVTVGGARFRVVHQPEDADAAEQVTAALRVAVPRASRWGSLSTPVTIAIHPTHDALEAAVRRPGYEWLRAWARHSRIDVQSPRTWRLFGASDADVAEILTHELAHCAMYQQAATEYTWPFKGEPLWFREGLASVTAGQGYRRGSLEDLWRYYAEGGGVGEGLPPPGADPGGAGGGADPIANPEPLYQRRSYLVYDASHHAFAFLLARYGEARVRGVLRRMGEGSHFGEAFQSEIGISEAEFAADFRRYVVWQGWRR
ncbi:MAG TPA: hypothetical protein VLS93_02050 [Anaeromyxobacteraceae bacterium]|nr:hypothetical protein [Anaeromyxobacteraceae bacterium]